MKHENRWSYQCLSLPTPFPVGRVNAYLLIGQEPILIDVGVKGKKSLDELQSGLSEKNVKLEDIRHILITHPHHDHSGAAVEISKQTGAQILCHQTAIRDEKKGRAAFSGLLRKYGAPQKMLDQLKMAWRASEAFGDFLRKADHTQFVEDDEVITLGGITLRALSTPGHSPGHLCFVSEEKKLIFCGDLLLAQITANPLPHFDETAPRGRHSSLSLYLESLDRLQKLGPYKGLPGHGETLERTDERAKKSFDHILKRSEKVFRLIQKFQGLNLFELAEKVFWEKNVVGQALAFSEVLAHTDMLEDEGKIRVDPESGIVEVVGGQS